MSEPLPTFDGYETLEKLGEGGMCAVYRVNGPQGEVAIKLLLDKTKTAAERFATEAEMLMALEHPNVLRVFALHEEAQPPWIVMELLAGKDLEETRVDMGPIGPEQAAMWFADLANGLSAVHAQGVRHRDLKPANIMLGHDGVPRLIDFGIARQTNAAHVTRQGFVLGTASYLPPEIFLDDNSREIQDSESADVYALGQSLCEMLTGESVHPRQATGNDATILVRIMKDKVENPCLDPRRWRPQVPEGLAMVVRRATAQDPEDRIPTAAALEKELRDWLVARRTAEVAPLSTLKGDLPAPPSATPPPADRDSERGATPAPAPTSPRGGRAGDRPVVRPTSSGTVAPVARVAMGGAGAAGFLGIGGILATCLVLGLVGLGVLYAYSPAVDSAAVSKVVAGHRNAVAACRSGEKGDVRVRVRSVGGKVSTKAVGGSAKESVRSCIASAMEEGAWPPGTWTVTVPVELR